MASPTSTIGPAATVARLEKTPRQARRLTLNRRATALGAVVLVGAAGSAAAGEAAARQRADEAVAIARREADATLAGQVADLDGRSRVLDRRQAELDSREKALAAAEAARRAVSFADGSYEIGVDIQAGTYHAPGGVGDCIWKKLDAVGTASDTYKQPGPAVVTIEGTVKFFSTKGCGMWTKR